MHVLGLNFYHNDSSVALIKDGKIINAITEERLNRRKHSSAFPVLAIHEILEFNNLSLNEIDFITLNTNPKITLKKVIYVLKNLISKDLFINSFKRYQGKKFK